MIVQASIDEAGGIQVSIDSDGDQGDGYAPEVLSDLLTRAGEQAIALWYAVHATDDAVEEAGE